MNFTFPPLRFAIKAALAATLLGSVGFFIALAADPAGLDPVTGLTLGLFGGALVGGWLTGIGEAGAALPSSEPQSVFIGNLAFKARPEDLRELFSPYGDVHSVRIMTDRATRRPRGFAFVEMDERGARRAIKSLDGREFLGRKLRVNEGKQRAEGGPGREAA